jgi:hypothetical protein
MLITFWLLLVLRKRMMKAKIPFRDFRTSNRQAGFPWGKVKCNEVRVAKERYSSWVGT